MGEADYGGSGARPAACLSAPAAPRGMRKKTLRISYNFDSANEDAIISVLSLLSRERRIVTNRRKAQPRDSTNGGSLSFPIRHDAILSLRKGGESAEQDQGRTSCGQNLLWYTWFWMRTESSPPARAPGVRRVPRASADFSSGWTQPPARMTGLTHARLAPHEPYGDVFDRPPVVLPRQLQRQGTSANPFKAQAKTYDSGFGAPTHHECRARGDAPDSKQRPGAVARTFPDPSPGTLQLNDHTRVAARFLRSASQFFPSGGSRSGRSGAPCACNSRHKPRLPVTGRTSRLRATKKRALAGRGLTTSRPSRSDISPPAPASSGARVRPSFFPQ
jgi:hypothetical protein